MQIALVSPFSSPSSEIHDVDCSKWQRITLLTVGVLAALVGILTIAGVSGFHVLGTTGIGCFFAIGALLILASCISIDPLHHEKPEEILANHNTPLGFHRELSVDHLKSKMFMLYEFDADTGQPCQVSYESLSNIIQELKQTHQLYPLNTITEYRTNNEGIDVYVSKYTPVQYWAAKGDFRAVKLLVENGGMDFCRQTDDKKCEFSALLLAGVHGHVDVVRYLLLKGATSQLTLADGCGFLPKFISMLIKNPNRNAIKCLALILEAHRQKSPETPQLLAGNNINELVAGNEDLRSLLKKYGVQSG